MTDHTPEFLARFKKSYGRAYSPRAPDYARCCQSVRGEGQWPDYYQCTRKNGHGADGAYCKQHDPDVVAEKRRAQQEKSDANWRASTFRIDCVQAIHKIAKGHNDPRALAQSLIDKLNGKETP